MYRITFDTYRIYCNMSTSHLTLPLPPRHHTHTHTQVAADPMLGLRSETPKTLKP